jgi:dsDNA-binding SOS-regulon protein
MKETPIYYVSGKKTNKDQFFRNYWCTNYDVCLNTAAHEDTHLDCTQCVYKDNVIEVFSIFIEK